jgi:uncharacterized protein YutE (UPF0331/DUF86 family)
MLDKDRILVKMDELNGYLDELKQTAPAKLKFKEYQKIEKKRSCERLLQLSIEAVIDICKLFVSGMRLGLPAEENDLFDKMQKKKLLSKKMAVTLKEMKGFRNILVHEYADIDDELVFRALKAKLDDFNKFKKEIASALRASQ